MLIREGPVHQLNVLIISPFCRISYFLRVLYPLPFCLFLGAFFMFLILPFPCCFQPFWFVAVSCVRGALCHSHSLTHTLSVKQDYKALSVTLVLFDDVLILGKYSSKKQKSGGGKGDVSEPKKIRHFPPLSVNTHTQAEISMQTETGTVALVVLSPLHTALYAVWQPSCCAHSGSLLQSSCYCGLCVVSMCAGVWGMIFVVSRAGCFCCCCCCCLLLAAAAFCVCLYVCVCLCMYVCAANATTNNTGFLYKAHWPLTDVRVTDLPATHEPDIQHVGFQLLFKVGKGGVLWCTWCLCPR
jgi:hypothetical protein